MTETMHFEVPDGDLTFTIGKHTLHAYAAIPADDFPPFIGVVTGLSGKGEDGKDDDELWGDAAADRYKEQIDGLERAIGLCMPESSRSVLREGMGSREKPIPWKTLMEVLNWLMQKYGLSEGKADGKVDVDPIREGSTERPLEAPSDSSDTSSASGTESADD